MSAVDMAILLGYFAAMLVLGAVANKRQKDSDDYFVGGRKLGSFSIMSLWFSSWVGGAAIVGTATTAYDYGISGIWYVLSSVICCVLFAYASSGKINELGKKFGHVTYPDFIGQAYNEKTRLIATITTALAYIGYTAGQFAAAGAVLQMLFDWPLVTAYTVAAGIVLVYTAVGGLLAVTYTDWAQFVFIILGVVILGIPICLDASGGVAAISEQLPEGFMNIGNWGWATIIGLTLSMALSFFTGMDSYTKCFAAKNAKVAKNGTLLAAAAMFFVALGATLIGLVARLKYPDAADSGNIAYRLIFDYFPSGVRGIALVGVLAAIMSSADICMLTASANLSRDIYQRYFCKDKNEKHILAVGVIFTVIVGALGLLVSIALKRVIDILYLCMTINGAGLFLPTVAAMYWDYHDSRSACLSIVTSLAVIIVWYVLSQISSLALFQIDPIWPGFLASVLVFAPKFLSHVRSIKRA